MILANMLRLITFGGLAMESGHGAPPRLRPQRLAILAVLASAGDRGVSRERMIGLLWPDWDEERARHALRQALYALRQELGADMIESGPILSIDSAALASDVGEFRAALAANDRGRAASLARGPFLHGFYLAGAPEFERWVEEERASLAGEVTRALLSLAKEAEGDPDTSVEWWRQLTAADPLSGSFALGYLKALAARGDRAGALAFARAHELVVRRELEADPDAEIRRLEVELRALPSPAVVRVAPPAAPSGAHTGASPAPLAERVMPDEMTPPPASSRRRTLTIAAATAVVILAPLAIATRDFWTAPFRFTPRAQTFAVGMIREEGVPDSLRIGGVLTDMLATNLARVEGLSVLANSRLFELMRPGQDTLASGYSEVARRAGATEILQGRLLVGPRWGLAMEIQRVDLTTGLVKGAYRVAASDRYALIDSMTSAIAHDLRFGPPRSSVSDATTASPVAYRLYEEGLRAFYQYDQPAAQRLMSAALQEDSTFAMAAYYEAILLAVDPVLTSRKRALRLARRAPDRERLTITADLLSRDLDPNAISVAETLTTRYPNDPRAFATLAASRGFLGDWGGAVEAIERAITLDSAAEPVGRQTCRLCDDFMQLADVYFWWDSLPAAERTAQRFLRIRPASHQPWELFTATAARARDVTSAFANFRRLNAISPVPPDAVFRLRLRSALELYDEVERDAVALMASPRPGDVTEARWVLSIALRNEGRLQEALRLARGGEQPGISVDALNGEDIDFEKAVLSLEMGDPRLAVSIFERMRRIDTSAWAAGLQARHHAWRSTLLGMALAASGDTQGVLRMADTVEYWGRRSSFGRDRKAHHYLRGMALVAAGHDDAAVAEFREAIHSLTLGFTRVNLELARALLRLRRPREAVAVLQPALRGDIDASNLYVTRTELHELLARSFDELAQRDSAAAHYQAVAKAWERADLLYHARRDSARTWLAQNSRIARQ